MRVGIDTSGLYTARAGIARYTGGLLKGLRSLRDSEVQWFEFAWEVANFGQRQPQRALKTFYREVIWAKLLAPRSLVRQSADLYHATASYLVRPSSPVKCVVTLHDLAVLRYPTRFRRWHRWSEARRLLRLREVDRIICVSRFTADEAMRLLGLPASRLEVIHNGCDFHSAEPPAVEQEPGFPVPTEFFLFVGSLEPGKNLALIREVYRLAAERGIRLPPLLIVGARWLGVGSEGPPPADWHYLGHQPDGVLVYLYRRSLALVFPSKYEGFGLPIAEAMSLGCPVVCSPVASLAEVGGEAALYSELEPSAYLDALVRLHREPALRAELVEKGTQQAAKFSWGRCAQQTVEIYRSVSL